MINSREINELHPAVKRGAVELKRRMKEKGYDLSISSTYRDNAEQNILYAQGRSTAGQIVTNAKGGQSMHNYRLAFDIFKNVKGEEWSDGTFFKAAGKIWTDMGGEWGGSWKGIVDTPHFQFTNGLTLSQLQKGSTVNQDVKMKWELQATAALSNAAPATQATNILSGTQTIQYKVINVNTTLNIRSGADKQSNIVGKLYNGDVVEVSEIKNRFGKISSGWVSMDYLSKK